MQDIEGARYASDVCGRMIVIEGSVSVNSGGNWLMQLYSVVEA